MEKPKEKTKEQLQFGDERFSGLLNSLDAGVVVHAMDTTLIYNNPKASELLGLSDDQMKGKQAMDPDWKFLDEFNNPLLIEDYPVNKIISSKSPMKNMMLGIVRPKTDDIVWVLANGFPVKDKKGKILEVIINFIDITERKKIQDHLTESEAFNKTLLNTSPDIIYVYDIVENRNIYSNEGVSKILGYSVNEIKEMGDSLISSLMHKDDFEVYCKEILPRYQTTKDGEVIDHTYQMKHKNGEWYWLLSKECIFKRNEDGSPIQIFGMISDITERKLMDIRLTEQSQKLANILEGTNAGTWDWNIQTGEVEFNEAWAKIMGYALDELMPVDINTWINNVHPDDLPYANEMLTKAFNKDLDYFDVVFRQPHKDGHWIWVNARGKIVEWSEDGKPLRMSGTHLDITDRKIAEEELVKHRDDLENLVKKRTSELEMKNKKLDDAMKVFVGREMKIRQLQDEIKALRGSSV